MSLTKTHEMTEQHLDAIRRNQQLSHGPAPDQGRGRSRTAYRSERKRGAVSRDVLEK
jgi:hypothetical protein